jgi:hypothetical protein
VADSHRRGVNVIGEFGRIILPTRCIQYATASVNALTNISMSFWSPNIQTAGRIVRSVAGLLMLGGAFLLHRQSISVWPWILAASGAFVLYEGLRGWCIMRACKFKTPL